MPSKIDAAIKAAMRALGSSDAEIPGAIQWMSIDRCSPAEEQMRGLKDIGGRGFSTAFCLPSMEAGDQN